MILSLYNTLTRRKEPFKPTDETNVRMYACGPTVYDRAHLGNARAVVVYDLLFRLLRELHGPKHVTYVRNITDVDDKINAAAKAGGEPISALTKRVTGWFHDDMHALHALPPTHEPRATQHIPQMIAIIERLIANGHAYVAENHVLFAVNRYANYGALSGRKTEELVAGARIAVESYKRDASDFVLWKPADADDDPSSVFDSPWGKGRPGWHIECSAMSAEYLGEGFDIHGGGADLMFPHHENEIAQSCCAHAPALPPDGFARFWVHNGFLTVGGEKMSKSLGNFTTVRDVLDKGVKGEVIRLALLSTHYRSPLDWNDKLVEDAKKTLDGWYRTLPAPASLPPPAGGQRGEAESQPTGALKHSPLHPPASGGNKAMAAELSPLLEALCDDLNIAKFLSLMHTASPEARLAMGRCVGFFNQSPVDWFQSGAGALDTASIEGQIAARLEAKKSKNWAEADRIRKALAEQGITLEDRPDGTTDWRRS